MQFSLSGLFCGLTVVAAAIGLVGSSRESAIYRTGQELDLAILGDGVFQLSDPEDGTSRYTRRGRFHVDENGMISLESGGRVYHLEPSVNVTRPRGKIVVQSDGGVYVPLTPPNDRIAPMLGQFQLATFEQVDQALVDSGAVFPHSQAQSIPCVSTPGLHGAGLIQQGWLEEPAGWLHRLSHGRALALVAVALVLAALAWVGFELWQLRRLLDREAGAGGPPALRAGRPSLVSSPLLVTIPAELPTQSPALSPSPTHEPARFQESL